MNSLYLDSSAIVKRYVLERGSDVISEVYDRALTGELAKLLRLRVLRIVPVRAALLTQTWEVIEKYQVHEADALQVVSARAAGATGFYIADEKLHKMAISEGLKSVRL